MSLTCKWFEQTITRMALVWHGQRLNVVAHECLLVWPPNTAEAIMRSTCDTIHADMPPSLYKKTLAFELKRMIVDSDSATKKTKDHTNDS